MKYPHVEAIHNEPVGGQVYCAFSARGDVLAPAPNAGLEPGGRTAIYPCLSL